MWRARKQRTVAMLAGTRTVVEREVGERQAAKDLHLLDVLVALHKVENQLHAAAFSKVVSVVLCASSACQQYIHRRSSIEFGQATMK